MELSVSELFLLFWAVVATISTMFYHTRFIEQNTVNLSMITVMMLVSKGKATLYESPEGGIGVKYTNEETK